MGAFTKTAIYGNVKETRPISIMNEMFNHDMKVILIQIMIYANVANSVEKT